MGKISEEQKNDVTVYADAKDVDLRIASVCNTREEIDAVIDCIKVIKDDKYKYEYAVHSAPKDPQRETKKFTEILDSCSTEEERQMEWSYMEQVEPIHSKTMVIKNQIRADTTFILKSANIGMNRRREIIPILINNILLDGEK